MDFINNILNEFNPFNVLIKLEFKTLNLIFQNLEHKPKEKTFYFIKTKHGHTLVNLIHI